MVVAAAAATLVLTMTTRIIKALEEGKFHCLALRWIFLIYSLMMMNLPFLFELTYETRQLRNRTIYTRTAFFTCRNERSKNSLFYLENQNLSIHVYICINCKEVNEIDRK